VKTLTAFLLLAGLGVQDTPQEIPKKELPKQALCDVCEAKGNHMGLEKPAAGIMYKGRAYYLCNSKEIAEFKKDPEAFVPQVLPRPAPSFQLTNLAGEKVRLADFKGKVILVDFWATWCKPCIEAMPAMQKLHEKYADRGLAMLGVSIDEKGAKVVAPFVQKRKFTYPMFVDGGDDPAWKSFGVRSIPALFLIDKEGRIVKQWIGKPKEQEVEQAVSGLVKE
jgi:peroxiredoxin/YHS domain-containing protein